MEPKYHFERFRRPEDIRIKDILTSLDMLCEICGEEKVAYTIVAKYKGKCGVVKVCSDCRLSGRSHVQDLVDPIDGLAQFA
jgi:transcription elongation factor Elf1